MSALASQLQSIASLDAGRLTSRGGHPSSKSYLFPPKEAATHDLDAIFSLGVSGFEEIVSLDPEFAQFEDEIFSEHAKGNDRMLLNKEENRQLDATLERCLRRLGRWVGIMAGGKCIEWLVRRFRIHEMNAEVLLQVFLPYHSSPNFARILAILTLPKDSVYSAPFTPLISQAQPIPRSYISDVISPEREKSLRLLSDVAGLLSVAVREGVAHRALLAFWTGVMIDLLEKGRTGRGVGEGLVKVLVETFAELLSIKNGGKDLNAAVYPPLILLTRVPNLADGPFDVLLSSLLTPSSGAEPSQRLLTLLVVLNDRKGWQGAGQSGAENLAKLELGDMLVAAMDKYDFTNALSVILPVMVERLDLHSQNLSKIIDSGSLDDSLARIVTVETLAVTGEEHKEACRAILSSLRERYPSVVDAAVVESDHVDPTLITRPESETTMINLLSADVSARVEGLRALMEPHLNSAEIPLEEREALRSALLTRLADSEVQVLEAMYKTSKHRALIARVCPYEDIIQVVEDAFTAERLNDAVIRAHLDFITNDLVKFSPEAAQSLFEKVVFPVLLPSAHRSLSDEASKILKSSTLGKSSPIEAVDDFTSPSAISQKLAAKMSDSVSFVVSQFDSPIPSSRLLSLLVASQLVLDTSAALQIVDKLSSYQTGASLDIAETEPLSPALIQAILTKPKAVRTTERAIVGVFAALTRVKRPREVEFSLLEDTPYAKLAKELYIWSNAAILPQGLAKALLRSLFVQLGEDALTFFASIWTSKNPAGLKSSALRHALAYVKAHLSVEAGIDFQMAIPALLIALADGEKQVRSAATDVLAAIVSVTTGSENVYALDTIYGEKSGSVQLVKYADLKGYLESLVAASSKIVIDKEQVKIAHTARLGITGHENKKEVAARRAIIGALLSHLGAWQDLDARMTLLNILADVHDQAVFRGLLPLLQADGEQVWIGRQKAKSNYIDLLFHSLDVKSAVVLQEDGAKGWNFFKGLLKSTDSPLRSASLSRMETVFPALSSQLRIEYIRELLASLDVVSVDEAFATKAVLSNLRLDPASVISVIDALSQALEQPAQRKKQKQDESSDSAEKAVAELTIFIDSRDWKAIAPNAQLLASLLGVLSLLLSRRQSVKEGVDYLEQEILGATLAIVERINDAAELQRAHVGIEVIIKVIRASTNPRTSQRALLVAGELARLIPEAVLHNVMPIFTFMGASDLQRDDVYSFGVVEKTVQRIVPVMTKSLRAKAKSKLDLYRDSKTFITIFTDMAARLPRHRTLPFFVHLVKSLGPDDYLAPISMLLVDRSTTKAGRAGSTASQAMELPQGVAAAFDVDTKLEVVLEVVSEVIRLFGDASKAEGEREAFLFNVDNDNDRLLKQSAALLSFAQSLARTLVGKPCDQSLAEAVVKNLLLLASTIGQSAVSNSGVPAAVQSCLGTSMQLLSAQKFLQVVLTLLKGDDEQDIDVALNILVERLPRVKPEIRAQNASIISDILKRCASLIGPNSSVNSTSLSALHAIASTAQKTEDTALAGVMPPLIAQVVKLSDVADQIATLSLLEIATRHLGSRVIPFIQSMVDVTLAISSHSNTVAHQASTLQSALIEVVPTFIGAKQLNAMLRHAFVSEGREVVVATAKKIPTKTAFPVVMELWKNVQADSATVLSGFFELLRLVLKNADRTALSGLIKPVFAFFLDVFDLRHRLQLRGVSQESILSVETSSIGSFLELVTKLNEASFKPLFVRLYDWAVIDLAEGKRIDDGRLIERRTVLFHVMMGLLTKFKNILSPYIGTLQPHIEELLVAYQDGQITDEPLLILLLDLLNKSFDVDDGAYWTDALDLQIIPLLVNLLDTPLTTSPTVREHLANCLGSLAGSTTTENVLKTLNTSICLSSRSDEVSTRLASLNAIEAIWTKQSDELASFVSETVGEFLSELIEDENNDVEVLARKVLGKIESITGDLKEYLE